MDDIQILVVHSRGVYNMAMIWWHTVPIFHCSVIMHSFFFMIQILAKASSYVHFKTFIRFALRVSRTKGYSFKFGASFVELAVNGEN